MVRRRLLVERLGERRVLAAISGAVFEDADLSLQREVDESAAASRLVFIDSNQNERLDNGEPIAITGEDGSFRFEGLADGRYLLRLFNGTSTQIQTTPVQASVVQASVEGPFWAVTHAAQLVSHDSLWFAITDRSLLIGDRTDGQLETISLGQQLSKLQTLPDGNVLVVGSDPAGPSSWLVNPFTRSVTVLGSGGESAGSGWNDVVLDGQGRGLLLENSEQPFALRSVDASRGGEVQIATTSTVVPADTQVMTSPSGHRSVLAWAGADGLQLSMWSNVTSSLIADSPVDISGAAELLAFDDDAGLLALRTDTGAVRVHDVDGGFAPLHTLEGIEGPVAMDGSRQLLVGLSADQAMLQLYSLRSGELLGDWAVDLTAVGPVTSIAWQDERSIAVLGAAGITEIALRKPRAQEVTISDGQDADPVLFGVALRGSNTAPFAVDQPRAVVNEDGVLVEQAPGILAGAFDAQGDQFVVVQRTGAAHGAAVLEYDGAVYYAPQPDFFGTDQVSYWLHDGRSVSDEISLELTVRPVPDAPTGFDITIGTISESIAPGTVVGTIDVVDADGMQGLQLELLDPRFGVDGGQIIFLGGVIDFGSEPSIDLPVKVTDTEAGTTIETVIGISVADPAAPQPKIWPDAAQVAENLSGVLVTFMGVQDRNPPGSYRFSVDDSRFRVVGDQLHLAEGVSLDYETEPIVTLQVTATHKTDSGVSVTEPIEIAVIDVPEQPGTIQLSNDTVMEKVPGDVVGHVTVDGVVPDERFLMTVDDPRFEIVDGILKLLDQQIVEYADQTEIELEIAAHDTQHVFTTISRSFVIHVMENDDPYHNHHNPYDVDHSGQVTALDALAIINYLNTYGPGPINRTDNGYCYDVNADEMVTALDVLLVLNEINRIKLNGGTVGSGEGAEGENLPAPGPDTTSAPPAAIPGDVSGTPISSSSEDQVFGQWGDAAEDNTQDLAGFSEPPAATQDDPADQLSDPSSQDVFVEGVDQTLRLLSDDSA